MATHSFYQLDVFADTPLTGNPLAVFPNAEGFDARTMQRIAREMNLSETAFVLPSDRATRRTRFFTPTAELPLAGPPTVGTWWLLAEQGVIDTASSGSTVVTQETAAGVLPVEITTDEGVPTRVTMTQAEPAFLREVDDRTTLAAGLGTDPAHLADDVPQVISTAVPQLIVRLASRDALRALPVGGASHLTNLLSGWGSSCVMCCVLDGDQAHCRMFAPGIGVPEDPATGSAAGALGAYLVQRGLIGSTNGVAALTVHQGHEIDRPSVMHVTVESDGTRITTVRVGGSAISVIAGELTI